MPQCEALPTDIFNQIFKWFFDVISCNFFQLNRTVLHYAARCPNEATRTEIIDEMIMNGADKFAKDAFGNDAEYYFTHELNTNKQLAVGSNDKPNGATNGQTDDEVFDDSSPVIESAIQDKNFDKLVKYVLEGDSERLSGRSSEDEEMQEFIKNIPAFQVIKITKKRIFFVFLEEVINCFKNIIHDFIFRRKSKAYTKLYKKAI